MKLKPKTIALLIVFALFLFILLQNMNPVEINLLIWPISIPKLVLIISSVFFGWVVGWFSHLAHYNKKSLKHAASKTEESKPINKIIENPE